MLIVAGVVVLVPDRTTPVAAPPPAATPTPTPQRRCDPAELTCRGEILRIWRAEMAVVVQSYLDPKGEYFSGYGYRYDERYDTPGFWSGNGGALAFEMFRLDKGATVVYLQIATDRRQAVRCGATVGEVCRPQKFLSGNFFNLTQTSSVTQGMEVQYRPAGREVITVIARNTTKGRGLRDPPWRPDPAGPGPAAQAARDLAHGVRLTGYARPKRATSAAYRSRRPGPPHSWGVRPGVAWGSAGLLRPGPDRRGGRAGWE